MRKFALMSESLRLEVLVARIASGFAAASSSGEQLALGLEILEDRFDHDVGAARAVPGDVGNQPVGGVADAGFFPQAALEELGRALHRGREALGGLVLQRDRQAAHHAPCGDVSAHHARADHVHVLRFEIAFLAERLHALLEEVDADQVARGVAFDETGDRRWVFGPRRERVTVVFLPEIDDRVGRGVVVGRGARGDLPSRHPGDERPHERGTHQPLYERQLPRARRLEHHHARGVLLDARRHCGVHEAHALRAARVDRASREHHVERGGGADHAREAHDPAPRRKDAEHHLGQREARSGLIDRDAVAAGERELDAPAHAEAVDQGERREGQGGELVVEIPASPDQAYRVVGVLELGELFDIGTGDEARVLARADDEPAGPFRGQLVEDRVELRHYLARKDVRVGLGLVQGQPDQIVAVGVELPVFVGHVGGGLTLRALR